MSGDQAKKVGEIYRNEGSSTLFVDNLVLSKRTDGLYLLRFTTSLPEGFVEQCRMIVPSESMKRMLDLLCVQCDYFPAKSKQKVKQKTNSGK